MALPDTVAYWDERLRSMLLDPQTLLIPPGPVHLRGSLLWRCCLERDTLDVPNLQRLER